MLGAVGWTAAVVAVNGLLSLATGLEVEPVHAAGPLAEPVAIAVVAVVIAVRAAFSTAAARLLPVETLLIAFVGLVVVPAVVAALSGPGPALVTLARSATSPFTIVDAVLAGVAGLVVLLVVRARAAGAGRPRWPWEGQDGP